MYTLTLIMQRPSKDVKFFSTADPDLVDLYAAVKLVPTKTSTISASDNGLTLTYVVTLADDSALTKYNEVLDQFSAARQIEKQRRIDAGITTTVTTDPEIKY